MNRLLPHSHTGIASVALAALFFLCIAFVRVVVTVTGQGGGDAFTDNLLVGVPMLVATAAGVAALVTGLVALIRSRDRSLLVWLAAGLGLLLAVLLLGELLGPPH